MQTTPKHVFLFLERLNKVKPTMNGWDACCPAHEDTNPSLGVAIGEEGAILLRCRSHGCTAEAILSALGLTIKDLYPEDATVPPRSRPVAYYSYCAENGDLLFEVVRTEPKGFFQRRPDCPGQWINDMHGVRRVPYRLNTLATTPPETPVYIVEGEKDVDTLVRLGLLATCNPGGAGKWRDDFNRFFAGRPIIIIPDNDQPGRDHAQSVARSLLPVAASVKVLHLPDLPDKGDVTDWLATGGTKEKLQLMTEQCPAEYQSQQSHCHNHGMTAAELMQQEFEPYRQPINGHLSEGLCILASRPKVGKSWLGTQESHAIATGSPIFGIPVVQAEVLYLALEDSFPRLQSRIRQQQAHITKHPDGLYLFTQWPRGQDGLAKLDHFLTNHPRVVLVVIDTWPRFRPGRNSKANAFDEDYSQATEVKNLAMKYRIAIQLIAHTRKEQTGEDWIDSISGTLGFAAVADVVRVLTRPRNSPQGEMKITGRDIEERDLAVEFDKTTGLWKCLGDSYTIKIKDTRKKILDLAGQSPVPITAEDVSDELSIKPSNARQTLRRMLKDGQLKSEGTGKYSPL
jgi:hypothetical protein